MMETQPFDAVSFDVYGTLLNWEPEIAVVQMLKGSEGS